MLGPRDKVEFGKELKIITMFAYLEVELISESFLVE